MTATIPDDVTASDKIAAKARERGKEQAFADEHNYGLSVREYIATAAMNGLLAYGAITGPHAERQPKISELAVQYADSLLAELAK